MILTRQRQKGWQQLRLLKNGSAPSAIGSGRRTTKRFRELARLVRAMIFRSDKGIYRSFGCSDAHDKCKYASLAWKDHQAEHGHM